jgi:hypothetical protein
MGITTACITRECFACDTIWLKEMILRGRKNCRVPKVLGLGVPVRGIRKKNGMRVGAVHSLPIR